MDQHDAARRAQTRVRELDRAWALTLRLRAMSGVSQSSSAALVRAAA
jgi:hypothetical protein